MVRCLMLNSSLIATLRSLASRLDKQPVNWAITASCSLALQGVPVAVRDIDVTTDRTGAYRIEQLFSAEMTRPVRLSHTETIQSFYGALLLEGYEVEVIGDAQYRRAGGEWDTLEDFAPHKHFLQVQEFILPVLTLEYEYSQYVRLGREAKVKLLAGWLGY